MGGFLIIVGLLVLLSANDTMPGMAIGGGLVVVGAIIYIFRKEEAP